MKPTLAFWIESLTVPMLAGGLVFGLAAVLAVRWRSGRWQRAVWLAAFATLGLFLLGFWIGAERWLRLPEFASVEPGGPFRIQNNLPVRETAERAVPTRGRTQRVVSTSTGRPLHGSPGGWWPGWIWLGGTLLLLGRIGFQRLALLLVWRRGKREPSSELGSRAAALAERLGMRRRIRVYVAPGLLSPAAFGWRQPTILVPGDFTPAYAARQRDVILAHELAHLAARDPFWHEAPRGRSWRCFGGIPWHGGR